MWTRHRNFVNITNINPGVTRRQIVISDISVVNHLFNLLVVDSLGS